MKTPPKSISGVCNTGIVSGPEADPAAAPDLLIEVPHGATRPLHYESLRGLLKGEYPEDLIKFFFVNTDVGAPETAVAVTRGLLAERPELKIRILRCMVPRTFVDCNRTTESGGDRRTTMTPQIPPYVTDPVDIDTVTAYYRSYLAEAESCYEEVCGNGGYGLILHSYAPRSVFLDLAVGNVVEQLTEAWRPKNRRKGCKRPDVEMITEPEEGEPLAPAGLIEAVRRHYAKINIDVRQNETYRLHPETLGLRWSQQYPGRILCIEFNRERLVKKWTPMEPLEVGPRRVRRLAKPLVSAMAGLFQPAKV